MRIFWTIAPAQGLDETNDLSALLKTCVHHRKVHVVRKQRIRGNHNVTARNEDAHRLFGEIREEFPKSGDIRFIQDRKPWKRASLAAVEGGRNTPDSPAPAA